MKSIRRHLSLGLVLGLALLWLVGGASLYAFLRSHLLNSMDAELGALLPTARFIAIRGLAGRFAPLGMPIRGTAAAELDSTEGKIYLQLYDRDKKSVLKSQSLGDRSLPLYSHRSETPQFEDQQLSTGEPVRVMSVYTPEISPPPGMRPRPNRFGNPPPPEESRRFAEGYVVVLAHDRREMDRTLAVFLGGLSLSGLLAMLASAFLVRLVLRSGLAPLNRLGIQAATIDIESLTTRFSVKDMPHELQPITARLNDLMARLEAGFERERRFGANLAHELRTPVSELRTWAEVALKWPDRLSADGCTDVLAIAKQMEQTVEDLLLLARVERNASELRLESVELQSLLQQCWEPLRFKATARQLEVQWNLETGFTLTGDRRLLGVIVSNLLSNAVDYAPEGSIVTLASGSHCPEHALLCIDNDAPHLVTEDLTHFFERLWRHDRSRTDASHSGLGLSIAQSCSQVLGLKLRATLSPSGRLRLRLAAEPNQVTRS